MKKVLIIAEAGVNHNGSIELAKKLVDAAAVIRVVHTLATFGNVEVEVAVIVKISPNAAVITGVVGGRHGGHVYPVFYRKDSCTVVAPNPTHGIIVAGKDIEPAVVVDVCKVGALQKNA